MKIVVCIKQVPARDAPLVIAEGGWIRETDIGFEMNEPDSFALEEALRLKEKHTGEVIAVSMGPERVKQTFKEALAKGADRGVHIADDKAHTLDPLGAAKSLAAAIEREKPDLVLTGLQSDDHGFGQTGVLLADRLGLPHATLIMQIGNETKSRLAAAVIGKGVADLAGELAASKLDEVLLIEHDLLAAYTPDGFMIALTQAIAQAKPDLILLPHTYQVRDFAPKLAASLGKGMIGDCIAYRQENGKLTFVRQMFQGKTAADVVFEGAPPWFATFQAGAFRADLVAQGASRAPVTLVPVELNAGQIRTKPLEIFREAK